jgi:GH15 family glucan-1,4-alpha-glucosidase
MSPERPRPDQMRLRQAAEYLRSPGQLRRDLTDRGVFAFPAYESGLLPASDLSPEQRKATGMGMAWFRDNALVAYALYRDGRVEEATRVGVAFLNVLHNNQHILSGEGTDRLPVRVEGDTLANDLEPRRQNDSVGYALWLTSRLINDGAYPPTPVDLERIAQTARYLERVEYWNDPDEGHWEEDRRVHGSSIGVDVAALHEAEQMLERFGYQHDIDFAGLIVRGSESLYHMLEDGVTDRSHPDPTEESDQAYPDFIHPSPEVEQFFEHFSLHRREHDAALLFLVEPLGILHGELAERIVAGIEDELVREHGTARYAGDTYWEPRFPDIMTVEERTTQAEGRTEQRNLTAAGVAYTETEAQWTMFDPILSAYWGKRYAESEDRAHREKQLLYLDRSLGHLKPQADGRLVMPEAHYYHYVDGQNSWIANDHSPLLWAHANLLTAVRIFEETSPAPANQ